MLPNVINKINYTYGTSIIQLWCYEESTNCNIVPRFSIITLYKKWILQVQILLIILDKDF